MFAESPEDYAIVQSLFEELVMVVASCGRMEEASSPLRNLHNVAISCEFCYLGTLTTK